MKRNQIIAAMNMLPEDCDVDFGLATTIRQVELASMMSVFMALASIYKQKTYELEEWPTALNDVFSSLGLEKEAKAALASTVVRFDRRIKEMDDSAIDWLAKLAMEGV